MRFDRLTVKPCVVPSTVTPCGTPGVKPGPPGGGGDAPPIPCCDIPEFKTANPVVCPADDARCSDPVFAAANPTLCPNAPRLILKPSYLLKDPLQQVAYEAVLLSGGKETAVTGVKFGIVNPAIAQIGVTSGKLTTLQPGITTVSAEWAGGLRAYGQVEVLDHACATHSTNFLLLIDDSASMGVAFGGQYPTKLNFAKALAVKFVQSMDLTKDRAAVYAFNTGAMQQEILSQSQTTLISAIQGIGSTTGRTNLAGSLQTAVDYLAAQASENTTNVIVLFTDGENKSGDNPIATAAAFQTAGGLLMVCGVRSYDGYFTMLDEMASGGFFCNGYPGVETAVSELLVGLKGYICAGFCLPPGDVCIAYAALDYEGFAKWDVDGKVDLIGGTEQPLFDLLPGNGLYLDMAGSSPPWAGNLTTKDSFDFDPIQGKFRLTLKVAGNQRQAVGPWSLRVRIGTLLDEVITVTNYLQDFTEYSFDFDGAVDTSLPIEILTEDVPTDALPFYGLLVDDVALVSSVLEDFTDAIEVFADDFDGENVTCFPPNCTNNPVAYYGTIPTYGYCPSSGCLDELPVPAQSPDPHPSADIEACVLAAGSGGTALPENPFRYCNTQQSATATCPDGTFGNATAVIAAGKYCNTVSQASANADALAAATALAAASLDCVEGGTDFSLISGGLNSAVYEEGRDVIFACCGGHLYKLDATTGEVLASAVVHTPDWDDTYLAYSSVDDRLYIAYWLTYDPNGDKPLYRVDPDTLAIETTFGQDADLNIGTSPFDGIRQILSFSDMLYLVRVDGNNCRISIVDPTALVSPIHNESLGSSDSSRGAVDSDGTYLLTGGNDDHFISRLVLATLGNPAANTYLLDTGGPDERNVFGLTYCSRNHAVYYVSGDQIVTKCPVPGCDYSLIDLDRPDATPFNIRTNPYNNYVYVPLWKDNSVAIIDPRDDTFQIVTGFNSPFDVVFTPTKAFAVLHSGQGLKEIVASLEATGPYVPPVIPPAPPTELISYYTMEEASGTRMDSKGTNHLALQTANAVGSDVGIQGNAASFTINSSGLTVSTADFSFDPDVGITVCFWIKFPTSSGFQSAQPFNLVPSGGCPLYVEVNATGFFGSLGTTFAISDGTFVAVQPNDFVPTANTWYFVRLWVDPVDKLMRRQINGGTVYVAAVPFDHTDATGPYTLFLRRNSQAFLIDELGIWHGALTDGEADALYNAGVGVTWPDIPYA